MNTKFFKAMLGVVMVTLFTISCTNKTQKVETTQENQRQQGPPPQDGANQGGTPPQGGQGQQQGGARMQGPPKFSDLLAKMDSNKDGKLSKSEATGPLVNDFSKIDSNGNGQITEDEMKNAPKPQRPKN